MKRFIIINLRTGLTLFRSMYPPISPPTIPVSLNLSLFLLCSCCQVLWIMSSKHVAQCMVWHWSMDIAPASRISMRIGRLSKHSLQNVSAVQLSVSQHIVVLLWYAGQHIDPQSFILCPLQINVCLNTSIEYYCRMWLSQQSSIKENIRFWFWRRALY